MRWRRSRGRECRQRSPKGSWGRLSACIGTLYQSVSPATPLFERERKGLRYPSRGKTCRLRNRPLDKTLVAVATGQDTAPAVVTTSTQPNKRKRSEPPI